MKLTAVTIVENKFWVVEDQTGKSGTVRFNNDQYEYHHNKDGDVVLTEDEFLTMFKVVENETAKKINATVFGYPCKVAEPHDMKMTDSGIPTYKKSTNAKIVYAAGWYGLYFPTIKWREAFSVQLDTLSTYDYIGPFKTEDDMKIAIKRLRAEEK